MNIKMNVQDLYNRSNAADEVIPGLWLGNRAAATDQNFSKEKNIRAVFNCSKDIPFNPTILRQYRVPVDDSRQEPDIGNLEKWSFEIVYKISHEMRRAKAEGSAVLVHCAAGMQRSAASVAMYLIAVENITADQAISFIQSKRPIAFRPEANFEKSIRGFEVAFNRDVRPKLKQ
jgi:protein-tyrosine phosphatase